MQHYDLPVRTQCHPRARSAPYLTLDHFELDVGGVAAIGGAFASVAWVIAKLRRPSEAGDGGTWIIVGTALGCVLGLLLFLTRVLLYYVVAR